LLGGRGIRRDGGDWRWIVQFDQRWDRLGDLHVGRVIWAVTAFVCFLEKTWLL
jgi:hypothetical protein